LRTIFFVLLHFAFLLLPLLNGSAEFFEAIHPLFDHIQTRGVAQADGAIVSEGDSRYDCDVGLAEEAVGEVLRSQSEPADVHQDIERAARTNDTNMLHRSEER